MEVIPTQKASSESIQFPEISREIDAMTEVDQSMRERTDAEPGYWDERVDAQNTARMKQIVQQIGWPTISRVGKLSSANAWLLVQHADDDIDFQVHCLDLMKKEPEEQVDRKNIAYLEDRIRVNKKQLQVYGTQFNKVDGKFVPREIEDHANVDERRGKMALGTLQEGIDEMYEKYGKEKPHNP